MIAESTLTSVGSIFKPHGIKGEMSATLDYGLEPSDLRCIVLDIDGIYVPFFIESSRRRGTESWLLKIDGIDDEKQAAALANHEIYALKAELPEGDADDDSDVDGVYLYDLEGFRMLDGDTEVGTIDYVDDTTENILFGVKTADGKTVLVPFAEELITSIDPETRTIAMDLPEGIIDLNK